MNVFNLQFTDACNPSPCNEKHEICKVNEDRTSHLCIPNGKYCGLLWYCFGIKSAFFLTFTFFFFFALSLSDLLIIKKLLLDQN